MTKAHILGFPRIGKHREMKKAVESYWAGTIDSEALLQAGKKIRQENWNIQHQLGLDFVTVGDFSWYDHILDTALMLGVVPKRFGKVSLEGEKGLNTLFRMARGRAPQEKDEIALEMTKWFDTNYHYIVPELEPRQTFQLANQKLFEEVEEAKALKFNPKPTLIGPLSFLWLSKEKDHEEKLSLLDNLMVVYEQILLKLKELKVEWVQIEEPILSYDLPFNWHDAFERIYTRLKLIPIKILLTTYFNKLGENAHFVCQLPVDGLHIDLVRGPDELIRIIDKLPNYKILSAGIVDGRNIWRNDLNSSFQILSKAQERLGERLWVGSSCSLLHVPVDLNEETKLNPEIKDWLAFSVQKIEEIVVLTTGLKEGKEKVQNDLEANEKRLQSRQKSERIHKNEIKEKVKNIQPSMFLRQNNYSKRVKEQRHYLNLPLFPTTTIGSFPQTQEIRHLRRELKDGKINSKQYEEGIKSQIKKVVMLQEEIDLDVLVHGEAERNDMVEYFGEQLEGFCFTENGWVQSYGSRCVKPPIIYGDVKRNAPLTVKWSEYAQSLTHKPMKGMLTGPVTIVCWSFVRDDQSKAQTANQIALVLRDEIQDLEAKGIKIIQIDEPAFREGLPLRASDWPEYLEWAVKAFRLATSGVKDKTQIHTHMCYSEFNDVIESIAKLDADVITIETSRSQMELLEAFREFKYPNEIGPGVYDVHSPRVPTVEEIMDLLTKAARVISYEQLWVNPDCGLKTREKDETQKSLINMVLAAKALRQKYIKQVAN